MWSRAIWFAAHHASPPVHISAVASAGALTRHFRCLRRVPMVEDEEILYSYHPASSQVTSELLGRPWIARALRGRTEAEILHRSK